MKLSIYFLLIICLSITIGESSGVPTKKEMTKLIKDDQSNVICLDKNLTLSPNGYIYGHEYVMIWKGHYNDKEVAVKITADEEDFNRELKAYKDLEATGSLNVEQFGIARVYYHGPILPKYGNYFAIAMTLFDSDLLSRVKRQNFKVSEPTILLIFKETVKALSYIHSRNVYHCDLHMAQVFVRGKNEAFIGDFDSAMTCHSSQRKVDDFLDLLRVIHGLINQKDDLSTSSDIEIRLKQWECLKNPIVGGALRKIVQISHRLEEDKILGEYQNISMILENALRQLGPVIFEWK